MARNYFQSGGSASDVLAAGEQGWDTANDRFDGIMRRRAGARAAPKIAAGDYGGAAQEYGAHGMAEETLALRGRQEAGQDRERARGQEQAKLLIGAATALSRLKTVEERRAALSHPIFKQAGLDDQTLSSLSDDDLSDNSLQLFVAEVKRNLQVVPRGDGAYDVVDTDTGAAIRSEKGNPKPVEIDPNKTYLLPDDGRSDPEKPIATARPKTDAVFEALIQQESGGRPGVLGPQTDYGRAEGATQMLPATAESMARKLGVPWNPALMRDKTERGAAYQRQLGEAYFKEGLEKYGGDVRKALMYYHGGPDERLWGPKTRGYAEQVLARVGGGSDTLQGGQGGDDIGAPSGYRVLQRGQPKPKDAPAGYRWRGDALEFIPGGPADPKNVSARDASKTFTQEQQLRAQYGQQSEVKDLANVRAHIATIGRIAKKARDNPGTVTAQDDLALIFAFMKMLDPGSVVREGEFANAQNTAGIPDRVVNAYNKALKGTRLNDRQRAEFFNTASLAMDSYNEGAGTKANFYRDRATYYGLNPDSIAPKPTPPPARRPPPSRPAAKRPPLDDIFK